MQCMRNIYLQVQSNKKLTDAKLKTLEAYLEPSQTSMMELIFEAS